MSERLKKADLERLLKKRLTVYINHVLIQDMSLMEAAQLADFRGHNTIRMDFVRTPNESVSIAWVKP